MKKSWIIASTLLFSSYGFAANYVYTGAGADPNNWLLGGNWAGGGGVEVYPTELDNALFTNEGVGMVISQSIPIPFGQLHAGRFVSNTVTIATGAELTNLNQTLAGVNQPNQPPFGDGTIIIDGGTLNTVRLRMGVNGATGFVHVVSGLVNIDKAPTGDPKGTLDFELMGGGDPSFKLSGGTVTMESNLLLDAGLLTIDGADGTMTVDEIFLFNTAELAFEIADSGISKISADSIEFTGTQILTVNGQSTTSDTLFEDLVLIELTGSDTISAGELSNLSSALNLESMASGSLSLSGDSKQLLFTGTTAPIPVPLPFDSFTADTSNLIQNGDFSTVLNPVFGNAAAAINIDGTLKPNIILFFTDDHGWPDIGAAGVYDDLKTPHIDQLVADGVRCTNGYVTAPQCVPSRGGLLTGRDQSRFGLETNGETLDGFNAEVKIGQRLQKAGYKTGQTGKWHLGPGPEIASHGFDEVYYKNSARPAWATFNLDGSDREPGYDESGVYHLDACSQAATAFIDRHGDNPFFLYVAYRAPHVPLDAPEKYLSRFPGKMPERRRQALAMISAMDDGIGLVREKLAEKGLTEKTLIFFIGDNGAPLKIHKLDAPGGGPGWDGSLNEPMNGEKGMLAEGGIRVPFVAAWPGTIPSGQVYNEPVISMDVAATAVALAGLPHDEKLDGVNLIAYLRGEAEGAPHEALFWRWSSQSAIRVGDWKFLRGGSREYLFDIVKDPGESESLLAVHPEKATELRSRLLEWTNELSPPGFIGKMMPETWEKYFDHYLDGKPVSLKDTAKLEQPENIQGWIARNSSIKVDKGILKLLDPDGEKRLAPFIANNQLSFDGPFNVSVELAKPVSGGLSVASRENSEKDFSKGKIPLKSSPEEPLRFSGLVPTTATVIHLRVLFPNGNAEIKSIQVSDPEGEILKRWKFQ